MPSSVPSQPRSGSLNRTAVGAEPAGGGVAVDAGDDAGDLPELSVGAAGDAVAVTVAVGVTVSGAHDTMSRTSTSLRTRHTISAPHRLVASSVSTSSR